jgi:hypothetical protein
VFGFYCRKITLVLGLISLHPGGHGVDSQFVLRPMQPTGSPRYATYRQRPSDVLLAWSLQKLGTGIPVLRIAGSLA